MKGPEHGNCMLLRQSRERQAAAISCTSADGHPSLQTVRTYRHGLRAAEVCDLRWNQVDFNGAVLHVRRVKNGTPSTHPIQGDEPRALRRLLRESPASPFVFVSERGSPFTTAGLARMIERAAAGADLEIKAHPHMLRHACGYATRSPTRGTTRGRYRAGSGIGRSPARRSTRRWRRTGSGFLAGLIKSDGNGHRLHEFKCRRIILAEEEIRCRKKLRSITPRQPNTTPMLRSTIAKPPNITTLATTRKQHITLTPRRATVRTRAPTPRRRQKRISKTTGRSDRLPIEESPSGGSS
jgi:hypothetical protein